jgi:hypothetical protein
VDDYDGKAVEVLEANLGNASFFLQHGNHALEYRSLMCLARLSTTALMQFSNNVQAQQTLVETLNRDEFQSRNWTAAHVRLGEMQVRYTNVCYSMCDGCVFGRGPTSLTIIFSFVL